MKLIYEPDGTPRILAYDPGDLVRLVRDERGAAAMGRAGDWGKVEHRTPSGYLTIRIAGFSEPTHSTLVRLTDIAAGSVQPCNRRGVPTPPRPIYVRSPRRNPMRSITTPTTRSGTAWRSVAIISMSLIAASVGVALPLN
jgi:hypothetical protein